MAEHRPPAALVLRSPFVSLAEIGSAHYPILPVSLLLWGRYTNVERIRGIDAPVLVVAGSADRIVPTEQSQRVYHAASQPKVFVLIEGAGHNDFALLAGSQLVDDVATFLDSVMRPGSS